MTSVTTAIDDREIKNLIDTLYQFKSQFNRRLEDKTILRKVAKTVVQKLKQNAPVDSGNLRDSMQILPLVKMKTSVMVGPSYKGKIVKDSDERTGIGRHAHLMEYGFITKSGRRYPGRPFIKATYEMTKYDVKQQLIQEIEKLTYQVLR